MPASSGPARSRSPKRIPERSTSYSKEKSGASAQENEKRDRPNSGATGKDAKDAKDATVKEEKSDKDRSSSGKSSYSNSSNRYNSNSYVTYSNSGKKERKFTGRCRLFVGNLANTDEPELKGMFEQFGEVAEVFVNKEKGFGFIRLDTRRNAETAKASIDMMQRKGRILRCRFATHAAALKIINLGPLTSNDVLEQAFSQFGDVERAVVVCDDRGRSKGYGVVEFARKSNAHTAMQKINEGLFLLGRSPRPILVRTPDPEDDEDGIPDKAIERHTGYHKEREVQPHFAVPGSFEADWAQRWKALDEMEQGQREALDKQFKEARDKLENEMNTAIQEHEAMLMRQEIQMRQEDLRRHDEMRRREEMMRQELMRQQDMDRRHQDDMRIQEEMQIRDDIRRQEEILFRQKQEEIYRRRQQEDMMLRDAAVRGGFGSSLPPPRGLGGSDWRPSPGLGPQGGILGGPRLGPPGMGPPRGPGGPPLSGPMGPPLSGPMRPMRSDGERDRARERADRDRLAARSREPPPRDMYGDSKRRKY